MKQYLNPCAYKRSESRVVGMTACLLYNEPTSCCLVPGDPAQRVSRSESESEQGEESRAADAKPSDLSMARVKRG